MIELSLVLPIHNEEAIIESVFRQIYSHLKKYKISFEIILVENGSKDKSLKVIRKISQKYSDTKVAIAEQGYGSAVIEGYSKSRGKYICHMPSDGQVDVSCLPKLLQLIKSGNYDLVKVKRISRENINRYIVSKVFDLVIMLVFQTPFFDVNGDPKMFERKHLKKLKLQCKDSFIDSELMIKASYFKLRINEIPMKNINRYGGKSTRSINTFIEFFRNILLYRFSSYKSSLIA